MNCARILPPPVQRLVLSKAENAISQRTSVTIARERGLWATVNGSPAALLSGVLALYGSIACAQAATKLLWGDELITLAIARQGSLAGIWRALAAGADPNPPLSHWMVLVSTSAFGQGALAVRLPAVLCVLLAIVSLWGMLRRWVEPGYAAVGVLTFMASRGFDYAYDARSYAPLMGFGMASLVLWMKSANGAGGWRRGCALAGMAAALTLGISSNYYGALAFFPIAAGEVVRNVRARRVQPGAWVGVAIAALPLLVYRPLIRHNLAEFGPHAWNDARISMVRDSYVELVEGVFWPVLAAGLYAGWVWWRGRGNGNALDSGPGRQLAAHEAAAIATLLVYPCIGFAIARVGGGMISPRCAIPVCCGFGIAAALLARRVLGETRRGAVVLLAAMLLWVVARESACAVVLAQQRSAFLELRDAVGARPSEQAIVVGDSLVALPLAYYSNDQVRDRMVFPIDFEAIHAMEPDDSGEQNLWAGRDDVFPVRIVGYSALGPSLFSSAAPAGRMGVTVVARPGGWLVRKLAQDGWRLRDVDDAQETRAWQSLGGVFTPLAHEDTRLLEAVPPVVHDGMMER